MNTNPLAIPRQVTVEQVVEAKQYVANASAERPPVSQEYLIDRASAMLCHFYAKVTDETLREIKKIIAADWMDMLKDFPRLVVAQAFSQWRDNETRKPKPIDIRLLCVSIYGTAAWGELERMKVIAAMTPTFTPADEKPSEEPWKPPTDEQKANVAKMVAECLRNIAGSGTQFVEKAD